VRIDPAKQDVLYLLLLILIIIGLPYGIRAYDRHLNPVQSGSAAKEFALTGTASRGWVLGEVRANNIISLWREDGPPVKPVIEVSRGDKVVLKLRSADVTHGFSLKAFGIYVAEGIQPGKTVYVPFTADKVGRFIFMCTVFCGDIHQHMEGTLVVRDVTSAPKA
jgi:heme/copper-type cytochrome/quinol oxidase subunit 2